MVYAEYHFLIPWRLQDREDPPQLWLHFNPTATYVPEDLSAKDVWKKSEAKEATNKVGLVCA